MFLQKSNSKGKVKGKILSQRTLRPIGLDPLTLKFDKEGSEPIREVKKSLSSKGSMMSESTQPMLLMPLTKAWSEEARQAAAEARKKGNNPHEAMINAEAKNRSDEVHNAVSSMKVEGMTVSRIKTRRTGDLYETEAKMKDAQRPYHSVLMYSHTAANAVPGEQNYKAIYWRGHKSGGDEKGYNVEVSGRTPEEAIAKARAHPGTQRGWKPGD